jgi:short-subunit dehydrogenase
VRRDFPASALVTGASSGIGAALARQLAASGTRQLDLVARSGAALEALAAELGARHGVTARAVVCDLSHPDDTAALAARLAAAPPDLLVNNAGFGLYGGFADLPLEPQLAMLEVNVRALVHLSHVYVRAARARGRGSLVLVASTAGFVPMPFEAVYAASKSFVLHLGEALWEELRGTPVRVLTVCPGFTETDFAHVAGLPDRVVLQHGVSPEAVARTTVGALQRRGPSVVHGRSTQVAGALGRAVPRRLLLRILGSWMRRGLGSGTPRPGAPGPR